MANEEIAAGKSTGSGPLLETGGQRRRKRVVRAGLDSGDEWAGYPRDKRAVYKSLEFEQF